jgi:hypothetical protein
VGGLPFLLASELLKLLGLLRGAKHLARTDNDSELFVSSNLSFGSDCRRGQRQSQQQRQHRQPFYHSPSHLARRAFRKLRQPNNFWRSAIFFASIEAARLFAINVPRLRTIPLLHIRRG